MWVLNKFISIKYQYLIVQSAGAVEYTDCNSGKG